MSARRWLPGLPAPVEGVLWMALAALLLTTVSAMLRPVANDIPPIQLLFFRCAFSALLLLPFLVRSGWGVMRRRTLGLYTLRAALMFASMLFWIYAIVELPLAEATALAFTAPLFATMLAAAILAEHVGIRRWGAVIVGFIGALVIIRPGFAVMNMGIVFVLLNAASWAGAIILARILSRGDDPVAIVASMFLLITPMAMVPTLFVWETPSVTSLVLLVVMAVLGVLGHIAATRALAVAETSVVVPVEYIQLPISALLGFVVFAEVPDIYTPIGAAIIIAAVLYISRREAMQARRRAADPPAPIVPPTP